MHLLPPKHMVWSHSVNQTYRCDQIRLVTSGCSFTASTQQLESAASWPGYVRDRCKFDNAIDLSYPGMGNDYIQESIMDYVDKDCLVIVMWSGIDRKYASKNPPKSLPTRSLAQQEQYNRAQMSFNSIKQLKHNLEQKQIPYAFTQYINLIYPPFLPFRDTSGVWADYLDQHEITELKALIDIPATSQEFLYDYAFFNNYLTTPDIFHPPVECNFAWTDQVLLPNLAKKGLITKIDQ